MENKALKSLALTLLMTANTSFAWTTPRDAAKRLGATKVTEINFAKGKTEISKDEAQQLQQAIREAGKSGTVKNIKVLVWSDKEYPAEKTKAEKNDIKLAKERAQKLRSLLKKDLNSSDVDTYNMAERPNAIAKLFRTSDALVKEKAETEGLAPSDKKDLGLFDHNAHASTAVVLIFAK